MTTTLYVGIDLGKRSHVAAFFSKALLATHKSFSKAPTLKFENSRAGFMLLLSTITAYAGGYRAVKNTRVLLERTGHYGLPLEQFLQENCVAVHRIQPKKRYSKGKKTDHFDARALAVMLYNYLELSVELPDEVQRIVPVLPVTETVRKLRGLVRHRYELIRERTQRKNKLTSILDEIFPEFTQVYDDPNSPSALALREKFPAPEDIAGACLDELCATRLRSVPGNAAIEHLQVLARTTIGVRDPHRCFALLIEQRQLIAELRLLDQHIDELERHIRVIIADSREGKILISFTGIGEIQAATILSGIGTIANFEKSGRLKGYLGWAPRLTQSSETLDSSALNKSGNGLLKQTIYLATLSAIHYDPTWAALYNRLVTRLCVYDEKAKRYRGRLKALGHVAGQMIKVMYTLLKRDHELMTSWDGEGEPPPPELYDITKHTAGGRSMHQTTARAEDEL